jgi:hypothetical protein
MSDRSKRIPYFNAAYRLLTRPAIALALAVLLVVAAPMGGALAATQVGGAEVVVNQVTGTVEGGTRTLEASAPVYQNEIISTGAGGGTELQFLDGSVLTMGENSQVELTDLVFDPNPALSSMVLSLTTGAFNFATGGLDPDAYIVNTPSATIGIRGTVLAITIAANLTSTIAVTSGTITVTTITGAVVTVGVGGVVTVAASGAIIGVTGAATVVAAGGAVGGSTASAAAAASAAAGGIGTGAVVGVGVAGLAVAGVAVGAVTDEEDAVVTTTTTTTTTTTQ